MRSISRYPPYVLHKVYSICTRHVTRITAIMLAIMIVSVVSMISPVKANATSTIIDISTVGTITLERFVLGNVYGTGEMTIDGTKPVNDTDLRPMNMILHGQINKIQDLKPGDIVRIPVSSTGHLRFNEFNIDSKVTNADGTQLFTAAVNCTGNMNPCYLDLTATNAITSYSGSSQLDLSPVVSLIQNRHSRETILSHTTTITAGSSSISFTNVFPWYAYDYDTLGAGHLGSGIGYVRFYFGTDFFHSATQYLKTGKIIPQATVDRVITAKFTALNGGVKSFEMLPTAWTAVNLAFDEDNIGNMEAGGVPIAADEFHEVKGDQQWMQDPFEAAKHLSKGDYAIMRQPDGWLVAINLGSAVDGIEAPDVTKHINDDLTNTQVRRLMAAGFKTDEHIHARLMITMDHPELRQGVKVDYKTNSTWKPSNLTGTATVYSATSSNSSTGKPRSFVDYNANAMDATGDVQSLEGNVGDSAQASANAYARPGYEFIGWNSQSDGKGEAYKPGDQVILPENGMTLYAQWKALPARLVYKANAQAWSGNTASADSVTGQQVSVAGNGYKRDGWRFTGWNTAADGSGKSYSPSDQYSMPAGTTYLYAQWEKIYMVDLPETGSRELVMAIGLAIMALMITVITPMIIYRRKDC